MKHPYIITSAADQDIDGLFSFIDQRNHDAAVRFLQAAETSYMKLAAMPELGQRQNFRRPELAGLRVWQVQGFENFLIFYRPLKRGIEVVRVLHAARDIAAVFDNQGE